MSAPLPIFQTDNQTIQLMQYSWKAAITPVLNSPINQGILLSNIQLTAGSNTINHLLGRKMVGWILTDKDGNATIYRSEPLNNKTLTLTTDIDCMISLWVM